MKILIVSTLKRKVTADTTASRSQIIYQLAAGLAKKGHEVSLLGTGDSQIPNVKTIPVIERGWVDLPPVENPFFFQIATLIQTARKIVEIQNQFDLVSNHLYPEFLSSVVENELTVPMVTTVHSQATDFIDQTLSLFSKTYFISLSKAHQSLFKKTKFFRIVYNGIDTDRFSYEGNKDEYLLWLGRLSKAKNRDGTFMDPKGIKWAIELAEETGERLLMSGNVEDMQFFDTEVKPHLNDRIQWVGPVSSEQMLTKTQVADLMKKAKVFLMTVNWNEPFGLVMTEAMSCGTPVIGFNNGAVPEIVKDSVTGRVVNYNDGIDGLKKALSKIHEIKTLDCRTHVEENFSIEKMVIHYEKVYHDILSR